MRGLKNHFLFLNTPHIQFCLTDISYYTLKKTEIAFLAKISAIKVDNHNKFGKQINQQLLQNEDLELDKKETIH